MAGKVIAKVKAYQTHEIPLTHTYTHLKHSAYYLSIVFIHMYFHIQSLGLYLKRTRLSDVILRLKSSGGEPVHFTAADRRRVATSICRSLGDQV